MLCSRGVEILVLLCLHLVKVYVNCLQWRHCNSLVLKLWLVEEGLLSILGLAYHVVDILGLLIHRVWTHIRASGHGGLSVGEATHVLLDSEPSWRLVLLS